MSRNHNKKRNTGIIYELLLRHISNSLIADDTNTAQKALDIITKSFDKSTELYKEFRLFNALAHATVSDTAVAAGILAEAKNAARRCNSKRLDREKSILIKEINHSLSDSDFYHRRIPNYKIYATIQTLLNSWKDPDRSSLTETIRYESILVERLLETKEKPDLEQMSKPNSDDLVVKIMTEKINKRYGNLLNREQRDIIKEYVFSIFDDEGASIKRRLHEIKIESLSELERFIKMTDNKVLLEKISHVESKIKNQEIKVDDDTISRFLTISKLRCELREAINDQS